MAKSEGQPAVQGDRRVAEELRRARGALGPRHQRQPAHGLQPLLRQEAGRQRRPDGECTCGRHHPAAPDGVFFGEPRATAGSGRIVSRYVADHRRFPAMQKTAAVRRQGEHLGRPGVLLLHRGAHAARLVGSVLALRARPPARVGLRRHDHDVRDAVHDGGRLHAGEEQPRARRRALRLLHAAHAGDTRPHALHRVLHSRRVRADLRRLLSTPPIPGRSTSTRTSPPKARRSTRSRRSSRSPGRSCWCRASSRSSAASSASSKASGPRARRTSRKWTSTS